MSQLSQKTNQFNLTTKRYTETNILNYVEDENVEVYNFSAEDRFGINGLTGLCIVLLNKNSNFAEIDTFLMSCRVIGRNIEYSFIDFIINDLKANNIEKIASVFSRTRKNSQVENFYESCNFSVERKKKNVK